MKKLLALVGLTVLAACSTTPQPPVTPVTLEQVESMTPEQIRALSEEQMEPAFSQATTELEVFAKQNDLQRADDDLSLTASWPNYRDTLYVATSITYETYLSRYYRKYSGPNWSDDGCSGPTPPVIFDDNACRQHDFGYRNVSQYRQGRNETVRKSIDSRFLSNMRLRCDRRWSAWYQAPLRAACKADALVFYGVVRNAGRSSFYNTPSRYP
jgi:Prokaryotic phospholipase A2